MDELNIIIKLSIRWFVINPILSIAFHMLISLILKEFWSEGIALLVSNPLKIN